MRANCKNCGKPIEYNENEAGRNVGCPHCDKNTRLPKPPVNWKKRIRTILLICAPMLIVAVAFLFLAFAAPQIQKIDTNQAGQVIIGLIGLALALGIVILALLWLFLPVVIIVKINEVLKEMRKP